MYIPVHTVYIPRILIKYVIKYFYFILSIIFFDYALTLSINQYLKYSENREFVIVF